MKLGRADTMKLATLLVSVLYLATSVEAILPGPDPSAMAKCNADCAAAGHCCDGSTGQSSHALLSCNHGCQIAWYAANMAECKAHCQAGNAGGCFYKHAEAGKLAKCGSCQSGCDSSDRDECVTGCDLAFASGLFYRALHYTPPPPPPPHPHAACNVPTGMTATFLENMATHGYWSASAVFDDEECAHVQPGRQWLQNPRGMLCVDGETTPRSRIELFDDGSTPTSSGSSFGDLGTRGTRKRKRKAGTAPDKGFGLAQEPAAPEAVAAPEPVDSGFSLPELPKFKNPFE